MRIRKKSVLANYIVLLDAKMDSSIDNRRLYHVAVIFFYFNVSIRWHQEQKLFRTFKNMFIGWSSLLLRLGYGMLFGLLTIQVVFSFLNTLSMVFSFTQSA